MKKPLSRRRKPSRKDDPEPLTVARHAEVELKTVADALDHLNRNGPLLIGDILLASGSSLAPSDLFSNSANSE